MIFSNDLTYTISSFFKSIYFNNFLKHLIKIITNQFFIKNINLKKISIINYMIHYTATGEVINITNTNNNVEKCNKKIIESMSNENDISTYEINSSNSEYHIIGPPKTDSAVPVNCETLGMVTIKSPQECLSAAKSLNPSIDGGKRDDQPEEGYPDRGPGRTKGCTVHKFELKKGGKSQYFPHATGTCGTNSFNCICKKDSNEVREITKKVKTLNINGNLNLKGQLSAKTFGNITLGNDGKICIGEDTCLDKPALNKLIELSKKN